MDPVTLGVAAIAGSALAGGAGAIYSGNAASAAAGYNAKVAAQNAEISRLNAGFKGAEGDVAVGMSGLKTRAKIGATLANQAASGIDVNKGSPVAVRASQAAVGKLDALQIRSNAARAAYGLQTQATGFEAQSQLDRAEQRHSKTAGYINAASTVLGGAYEASQYDGFLKQSDPTAGLTSDLPTGDNLGRLY